MLEARARCLLPGFGCGCDEALLKAERLHWEQSICYVLNPRQTVASHVEHLCNTVSTLHTCVQGHDRRKPGFRNPRSSFPSRTKPPPTRKLAVGAVGHPTRKGRRLWQSATTTLVPPPRHDDARTKNGRETTTATSTITREGGLVRPGGGPRTVRRPRPPGGTPSGASSTRGRARGATGAPVRPTASGSPGASPSTSKAAG